jgi:hypothetical protein
MVCLQQVQRAFTPYLPVSKTLVAKSEKGRVSKKETAV